MGCGAGKEASKDTVDPKAAPENAKNENTANKAAEQAAAPTEKVAEKAPVAEQPKPAEGGEEEEIDLTECRSGDVAQAILTHPKSKVATTLKIAKNNLEQVPEAISQMPALTELDISENGLGSIESVVANCPNIVGLDCNDNPITTIEGIGSLKKLEKFEAYKMKLVVLPDELFQMKHLKELNLFNNQVKRVPPEMNQMSGLEQLNLASNKINQLPPKSLDGLKNLKRLALFWNRIVRLSALTDLVEMEVCQLQGNLLLEFPTMGTHTKLKEINLTKNEISAIPEETFSEAKFPILETLEINSNALEKFPASISTLPQLQKLSLSENKLTELPAAIWSMKSLTFLGLQENKLTEIPDGIAELKDSLVTLYLEGNQLKGLPAGIAGLKEIVRFSIKKNPLDKNPELDGILNTLKATVNENGTKPDKGGPKFIV